MKQNNTNFIKSRNNLGRAIQQRNALINSRNKYKLYDYNTLLDYYNNLIEKLKKSRHEKTLSSQA